MSPPSTVRAVTISASPVHRMRSGETTWTWSVMAGLSLACGLAELGSLGPGALGAADVQERLLGQVVEVAVDQHLERLHGLVDRGGDALQAGEGLGHVHRLRQEALDLAGP